MKLKDMPKEELELLSYTDLTYMILKEKKKIMNTPSIFREICNLLKYTEEEYASKIGDYYTSLTLDKRFVLLDSAEWDLRENRSVELTYDDEDDEAEAIDDDIEEIDEDTEEDEEESVDTINDEDDLSDDGDDIGLTIVDEEDLEEDL